MTKMPATIAVKFKEQLHALNSELLKTDPHYIRCIKPNPKKAVHMYTADMVLRQLIYAGVLETVRIRREGYPFRKQFEEFWKMCKAEGFDKLASIPPGTSDKVATKTMLTAVFDNKPDLPKALLNCWQLGHSKVFLKDAAWEYLLDFKRERVALEIQSWWRMAFRLRKFRIVKRMTIKLQRKIRNVIFQRKYKIFIKHALTIQTAWRRKLAYKRVKIVRIRIAEIEAARLERERLIREAEEAAEAERERIEYLKKLSEWASGVISRAWLCYKARVALSHLRKAHMEYMIQFTYHVIRMQATFRCNQKIRAYKRYVEATIMLQKHIRGVLGRLRARRQHRQQIKMLSLVKMFIERQKLRRWRRAVNMIASVYRMYACRKSFLAKIWACNRIKRCLTAHARNADLQAWIQDVFTLAEVGDDGFVEDLLEFHDDVEEYTLIQDIRRGAANIRMAPAYSTLLHSAAKTESSSPVLTEVIFEAGAELDSISLEAGQKIYWCARDIKGNTPLHIVATIGDRSLPVAVQLVERSANKIRFLNYENEVGATALDVAIENALSASSSHSDTFNSMIEWMFAIGGKSLYYGDQDVVNQLLEDVDIGNRRALEAADARASRRAEAERRKLHSSQAYKLELIRASEATRKENLEKERIRAAEVARKEAERKKKEARQAIIEERLQRELKIEMALQGKGWYYKDSSGNTQGPFGGDAMASWYSAGYLSSNLLVSSSTTGDFYSIAAVMEGTADPAVAFEESLNIQDLNILRSELKNLL
eukprot:g120.t1